MQRPSAGLHSFCLCVSAWICCPSTIQAQTPPAPPQAGPAIRPNYADNPGGLEKLVKDIMKAQKENNPSRAAELLQSMVLPNPRGWYNDIFGERAASKEGAHYESIASRLPLELATTFVNAQQDQMTGVSAFRYEKSCDDNAGEETFGILHARLDPVPLYELRLVNGNKFRSLFPFVFVDGAFRFILVPKMEEFVVSTPRTFPTGPSGSGSGTGSEPLGSRIRVGGNVAAAKILTRVQPQYPERARKEHLEGSVRLHAVIGIDGKIKSLNVIKGYCSLAEASLNAVQYWRYQPTLVNGKPVEVDTTVDVIFQLNR